MTKILRIFPSAGVPPSPFQPAQDHKRSVSLEDLYDQAYVGKSSLVCPVCG
jgi:hypothetical protein